MAEGTRLDIYDSIPKHRPPAGQTGCYITSLVSPTSLSASPYNHATQITPGCEFRGLLTLVGREFQWPECQDKFGRVLQAVSSRYLYHKYMLSECLSHGWLVRPTLQDRLYCGILS